MLLAGGLVIGAVTGEAGTALLKPVFVDPFKGVLALFMLELGLGIGVERIAGHTQAVLACERHGWHRCVQAQHLRRRPVGRRVHTGDAGQEGGGQVGARQVGGRHGGSVAASSRLSKAGSVGLVRIPGTGHRHWASVAHLSARELY
jgi:Na+-dependent bicarbonate transporter superfamily